MRVMSRYPLMIHTALVPRAKKLRIFTNTDISTYTLLIAIDN